MFRNFIVLLFSAVALVTIFTDSFGNKETKIKHFAEVGYDYCITCSYYFVNNPKDFCLNEKLGILLVLFGALIYFIMFIIGLPGLLWMALHPDRI